MATTTPTIAAWLVASAVAVAVPGGGPSAPELVEMEIAAVFALDDAPAGVLVLRQKGTETVLPIVVGRGEADALDRRLRHEAPRRPRTQELLEDAIAALGGRVLRVEISDTDEPLYRARVLLARGSERMVLDARPSDSVALAIAASAPIYAARALVETSGLTREDVERMRKSRSTLDAPGVPDLHDQQM